LRLDFSPLFVKKAVDFAADVVKEYYKPFIFTTDDNHAELLDCHYDELKDYFYFFNCGRTKSISKYLNKSAICLAAEECGLKIPLGEVVKPGVPPKKLRYPIFTKTIDSVSPGWKRDVFICHTEEEYITVSKMMTSPLLLVQEYIEKVNEVSMQGFSVNGGESVYMPYEKRYLRLTDTSYGGYMFYKKFENEDLKEKIKKLIKKVGFSGCFEIEFLEGKDGGLYFLEVNFRFSASNYGVNYGGVNQPIEWALATIEGKINESKFNLLQQLFVVMNEPKDIRSVRKTGILKWIWQFVTADSWYLYNAKDANPFFAYLYQKVIKKAKKIFK